MMTGMSEDREDIRPVLTITPDARATVLEVLANESESDSLALWLEVSGESNGAYAYDMYFQALADAAAGDVVQHDDDLPVVVPAGQCGPAAGRDPRLRDRCLGRGRPGHRQSEHPAGPDPERAWLRVPRSTSPIPWPSGWCRSSSEQVNPSIAAHGGRADLVAVEDSSIYLRLSGGCQGCGMAKATLSQGIEVILREAIPEIANVVDVTDHADGTNPYYEPAHS